MTERLGRNYAVLWTSSLVSNLGDGIGTVAWPWLASLITRDPLAIALVAVALRLPWLLFSLPAGVITDRFDRRQLVIAMDVCRFLILLALAILIWQSPPLADIAAPSAGLPGVPLYWMLLTSALAVGFAEVLRDNAAQTLMPAIVPTSRLEAANGRLWSIELLMNSLVGPPLAGLVIAVAVPFAFGFNAAGFALAALCVFSIRGDFGPPQVERRHWFAEMREGAAFLWRNTLLRDMALGLGVLNAMDHLMRIALVLYAQEVLQLSSTGFGLLLTAGALGGIAGGFFAEKFARRIGPGMALRLTLVVTAAQLGVIFLSSHAAPVWIVLVAGEFMGMIWSTITVTLRQRLVPQHLLGRVNSVYRFFGWGTIPLGIAFSGLIVSVSETLVDRQTALVIPFAIGAVIMLLSVLTLWRRFSDVRIREAMFE